MQGRGATAGGTEERTTEVLARHLAEGKAQLEAAEKDLGDLRQALKKAMRDVEKAQEDAARNHELRLRIDRARRAEREWAQELREQLGRLQHSKGTLAARDDVPTALLHLSRTLIEADKALLLARADEDNDGRLDLVAHEGFEHDPFGSAVAERFARDVLERDRIIREDQPEQAGVDNATPADEEIENLAAIPIFIHDAFHGVVVAANRDGGFEDLDDDVLLSLGDHAGAVLENNKLHGALRKAYVATVQLFADALEYKDPSASGEHERLADVVLAIGKRLDLSPRGREGLVFAWLLHDVGKLGISERLLFKQGPLTADERRTVDLHAELGAHVVGRVPALEPLATAIRHHHERFDGKGHPAGLAAEQIPLEARIIAVADAFGAMTASRPYRVTLSDEEALAELERCAGTQFDPEVVSAFAVEIRQSGVSAAAFRRRVDPVIEGLRERDEPVLGHGPVGLTDNLTLLYSHTYLHDAAEAHARRAAAATVPFTVVVIDLANLGAINERDGYAAGDQVLVQAARALERVTAADGAVACRYSGRRLAVVVPDSGAAQLPILVERIAAGLEWPDVHVRIGASCWEPGYTADDVVTGALEASRASL